MSEYERQMYARAAIESYLATGQDIAGFRRLWNDAAEYEYAPLQAIVQRTIDGMAATGVGGVRAYHEVRGALRRSLVALLDELPEWEEWADE